MKPIGRQCASGLSLLLSAIRFFTSSTAHGCSGKPPCIAEPASRNDAIGGVPGGGGGGGAGAALALFCPPCPRCPAGGRTISHIPERSGFPLRMRGPGALRVPFPSVAFGLRG